jgi:intracellular sulfur oxidation DsrE/DsrF family protein
MIRSRWFLLLASLLTTSVLAGSADQAISKLLAQETRPSGVVFEVVEGDGLALNWALPWVRDKSAALRERFPDLDIAVVSHGREQFGLLSEKRETNSGTHLLAQSLALQSDIPVHVCGTHASWYDKTIEDFPDYIDVAPSGPGQIRAYQDFGYELIVVGR